MLNVDEMATDTHRAANFSEFLEALLRVADGARADSVSTAEIEDSTLGVLRVVETVSGFGRWRVFWKATGHARVVGTLQSPNRTLETAESQETETQIATEVGRRRANKAFLVLDQLQEVAQCAPTTLDEATSRESSNSSFASDAEETDAPAATADETAPEPRAEVRAAQRPLSEPADCLRELLDLICFRLLKPADRRNVPAPRSLNGIVAQAAPTADAATPAAAAPAGSPRPGNKTRKNNAGASHFPARPLDEEAAPHVR